MSNTAAGQELSYVRPRKRQRISRLEATPRAVEIDWSVAALIVIDMQNDFLHPDGWFAARGVDGAPVLAVVPAVERATAAARAADIPVIWCNWGVRADLENMSAAFVAKGRSATASTYGGPSPSGKGRILVQNEWGAATIDELTVDPSDILVHKHRLSGFWDNELDSILRNRGITTLVFAGINTDRCVFTTLQDAHFLGYDCVLLEDACATVSPQFVTDAVLYLVRLLHGVVASSDAFFSAIGQQRPAQVEHVRTLERSAT